MNRIVLLLAAVFLLTTSLSAQTSDDDWSAQLSVELSKKLSKQLSLSFEEELRMHHNLSEVERSSTALGLAYKPFKFLKASLGYNLMYNHYEKRGEWLWEWRHRYHVSLAGDVSWNRFHFSLRERFQSTYRQSKNYQKPKNYLRSRLVAEYDIRKSPFEPYASVEMFYHIHQNPDKQGIDRWRYQLGCQYKLNKKNTLELFYRYTDYAADDFDDVNGHMMGLSYSLKF